MTGFELIEDVQNERKRIERIIKKYGNDPEQNCGYFLSHHEESDKCVFIKNGEYGIQIYLRSGIAQLGDDRDSHRSPGLSG